MTFQLTGKASIIKQPHRAFTRGLVGMDPDQIERKNNQKLAYQDQLRLQMEQAQKRKLMQKQKMKEEDEKLARKIKMQQQIDKQREEDQKKNKGKKNQKQQAVNMIANQKQSEKNNTNSNKNLFQQSAGNSMTQKHTQSKPQVSMFKNYNENDEDSHSYQRNNYHTHSAYDVEQERYIKQDQQDRFRRYRQSLDQKVDQIYRQIKSSKDALRPDNIIDDIRRKLNGNSYKKQEYQQLQKSQLKQFQQQFSQFYKIPKKYSHAEDTTSRVKNKNLQYGAESRYKSSLKSYQNNFQNNYQQKSNKKNYGSKYGGLNNNNDFTQRINFRNQTEYQNKPSKWGNKRKQNFLGNRQALDYQVDSMLSNIDNILQQHGQAQY